METPLLNLIRKHKSSEVLERVAEDGFTRIATLIYELGDLSKCILRGEESGSILGYRGEIQLAVGDITLQLRLLCEFYELDFKECIQLGLDHFSDRIVEYTKVYEETGHYGAGPKRGL